MMMPQGGGVCYGCSSEQRRPKRGVGTVTSTPLHCSRQGEARRAVVAGSAGCRVLLDRRLRLRPQMRPRLGVGRGGEGEKWGLGGEERVRVRVRVRYRVS